MARFSRPFQPEDWLQINQMYKRITGADRSAEEYDWEWRKTWAGQASIWLEFDDSRDPADQVIAQYGLIPTPMSFWGTLVKGAKTENCMSHPDFRGKGMYFFHEKKHFEIAKGLYEVFFTTAGHVARGAPGKVREKLGYRPFGHWVAYSYWLDVPTFASEITTKFPGFIRKRTWLARTLGFTAAYLLTLFSRPSQPKSGMIFNRFNDQDAPFSRMADLWRKNAVHHGVSIDRTQGYLEWRLKENPYNEHEYILMSIGDELKGYLAYTVLDGYCHIVDLVAQGADPLVGSQLLREMIKEGKHRGLKQIKMNTSWKNQRVINMLKGAKFKNYMEMFKISKHRVTEHRTELFVYVSESVQENNAIWEQDEWYITDLMKEGRPYTARLIE